MQNEAAGMRLFLWPGMAGMPEMQEQFSANGHGRPVLPKMQEQFSANGHGRPVWPKMQEQFSALVRVFGAPLRPASPPATARVSCVRQFPTTRSKLAVDESEFSPMPIGESSTQHESSANKGEICATEQKFSVAMKPAMFTAEQNLRNDEAVTAQR